MKRGSTGRYVVTKAGGEAVRAFIPAPLPPNPPLIISGSLHQQLEQATLSLGRLDALSTVLPDIEIFLYTYVRKEAVLSSLIEGTQSSLSDLLLFELDEVPGVPLDDVVEVSNHVAALNHGLRRLRAGFPLSNRLIREIHGVLLSRGRGSGKEPGEFRRSQNWIGGSRPGNAAFVPPPPAMVANCMGALEDFLHGSSDSLPVLVRAALAHVQFETIHPFLDGNGRIGRLLITFLLSPAGVLRETLLFNSLYLKHPRDEYYHLLEATRADGDWEGWLAFFLTGVHETADGAIAAAQRLGTMFGEDKARILPAGRRAGSMLRVHDALRTKPVTSLPEVGRMTGLTPPTAGAAMDGLVSFGIAREITGKQRDRVFVYDRYLSILNEGTERP